MTLSCELRFLIGRLIVSDLAVLNGQIHRFWGMGIDGDLKRSNLKTHIHTSFSAFSSLSESPVFTTPRGSMMRISHSSSA